MITNNNLVKLCSIEIVKNVTIQNIRSLPDELFESVMRTSNQQSLKDLLPNNRGLVKLCVKNLALNKEVGASVFKKITTGLAYSIYQIRNQLTIMVEDEKDNTYFKVDPMTTVKKLKEIIFPGKTSPLIINTIEVNENKLIERRIKADDNNSLQSYNINNNQMISLDKKANEQKKLSKGSPNNPIMTKESKISEKEKKGLSKMFAKATNPKKYTEIE